VAVDLGLVAYALGAGAIAFLSPCAVALLPAYAAFFLGTEGEETAERSTGASLAAGVGVGGAAATGAAALFAVGAVGVYVLRSQLGVVNGAGLATTFRGLGIAVGAGLVVLGGAILAGRSPRLDLPLHVPDRRTVPAMATFGAAFALASLGCTLPVFLAVLALALQQPALGAAVTLAAYGVGLAGLLGAASVGLALGETWTRERLRAAQRYVRPVSAAVLVLAGLYVVNYYLELVPVPTLDVPSPGAP